MQLHKLKLRLVDSLSNGKAFSWVKIATCQICNPLNNIQSFFFSPSCTFKLVGFQKVCKYVNTSVRGKYF